MNESLTDLWSQLEAQRLPRWTELPDLALYMDQVLSLVRRYLSPCIGFDEKGLTASMVNNYVKFGVVPPPQHKRYGREHLACLLMLCLLKSSLPIAFIQRLIEDAVKRDFLDSFYDRFCEMFEGATAAAAADHIAAEPEGEAAVIFRAALRAQAEKAIALRLYPSVFPDTASE